MFKLNLIVLNEYIHHIYITFSNLKAIVDYFSR